HGDHQALHPEPDQAVLTDGALSIHAQCVAWTWNSARNVKRVDDHPGSVNVTVNLKAIKAML
ncbi:hypothetical protein, partial [Vreelandella rituensis]|uniref:hypothetical protein n=1 Tax=Vreelandella rituensis TaxID=2282306 RepID=UPI0039EE54EC